MTAMDFKTKRYATFHQPNTSMIHLLQDDIWKLAGPILKLVSQSNFIFLISNMPYSEHCGL